MCHEVSLFPSLSFGHFERWRFLDIGDSCLFSHCERYCFLDTKESGILLVTSTTINFGRKVGASQKCTFFRISWLRQQTTLSRQKRNPISIPHTRLTKSPTCLSCTPPRKLLTQNRLFICGAADRSGRGKRFLVVVVVGTIFQSPMCSFLGCDKAKNFVLKGVWQGKNFV